MCVIKGLTASRRLPTREWATSRWSLRPTGFTSRRRRPRKSTCTGRSSASISPRRRPWTRSRSKENLSRKTRTVWPIKSRQMSIKVAQKWLHWKNERFWHLFINCQKCGRFGQNNSCHRLWKIDQSAINRQIWSHWTITTLVEEVRSGQFRLVPISCGYPLHCEKVDFFKKWAKHSILQLINVRLPSAGVRGHNLLIMSLLP